MNEGLKSSLTLNPNSKKEVTSVQYKQVGNKDDFIGELSDQQKQAQFNKQHEQYIKMKLNRKKELIKLKKEEFGTSSSQEKQQSSEEQIGEVKNVKKSFNKKQKDLKQTNKEEYRVILQLKKLTVQTELYLFSTQFQINKKRIAFAKIVRLSLFKDEGQGKAKLKVALTDQEFNITPKHAVEIFLAMLKAKLANKNIAFKPNQRKTSQQEYTSQQKEQAVAYDKLFKKSQIIGTWQERYVIIKPEGLYSYRALKSNPTMYITLKEIKQLQTQFDIYKQLLVVKLVYNTTKTDFGLNIDPELEWVSHFANLITK